MVMKSTSNGTAPSNGKPFIGYGRISNLGKREAGSNLSIERQFGSIDQTAERHHVEIGWRLSDEDVSGSTFDRPGWARAIELIKSGEAGGIVVWNQARTSRARAFETLTMIAEVEEAGGRIYSQTGPVSVATYEGEVIAFMTAASDRKEWVEKANGLKHSVADAIDRGAHLQAAYGYVKAPRVASRAMPLEIDHGRGAGRASSCTSCGPTG